MKRMLTLAAGGALVACLAAASWAPAPTPARTEPNLRADRPSVISVSGDALATAKPDRAQIDISVVTQASTARAAGTENAARTDRVIHELRQVVKPSAKIETTNYSLSPNYQYPREGGQPRLTGYTATNTVRVTTDDLREVGPAIDAAVGAGANNIQNLQFTLRDRHAAETRALREAATAARDKADALANALGLKVLRILEVTESGAPIVRPMYAEVAMRSAVAAPTPIQPGDIDVRAQVTLTVEVGP